MELSERKKKILDVYEKNGNKKQTFTQTSLFLEEEKEVTKEDLIVEKLSSVDPLNTTPLNALNIIYELKQILDKEK